MSFPKVKRHHWRKAKTLAMLANKRQWERDFDPTQSTALEIQTEQGSYLLRESSNLTSPEYIITE